jgi:hypothetical protein
LSAIIRSAPKQLPAVAFISGFLAEEDYSFVSKAWMPHVRVVYPYELGDKRQKNRSGAESMVKNMEQTVS